MFIVDPSKEKIAVAEARKLKIPVIAIIDTNCDPNDADLPIPANDDAIRSVKLISSTMANAILEAKEGEGSVDEEEESELDEIHIENESSVLGSSGPSTE